MHLGFKICITLFAVVLDAEWFNFSSIQNIFYAVYIRCSNKNCKKMKYLTTDLMNWYIESYNVKCPKNDSGELKGILGKYGPCIKCSKGHFLKPEEI